MAPLQMLCCPIAAVSISTVFAAWNRFKVGRARGDQRALRERVTYMLWVSASRY